MSGAGSCSEALWPPGGTAHPEGLARLVGVWGAGTAASFYWRMGSSFFSQELQGAGLAATHRGSNWSLELSISAVGSNLLRKGG